ncbi:MAG: NAD(P)H-hydrate dehydratase [Planctomycetota bacterium]
MDQGDATLPVFSTAAMRAADRATIEEFGIPGFTLMETAARGAAYAIEERCGGARGLRALVIAGKGNNGGDGLAIARILAGRGADVTVVTLAGAADATEDAAKNLALLRAMEGPRAPRVQLATDEASLAEIEAGLPPRLDVAVDALLGIGVTGPLREPIRTLATWCTRADSVVAIDVPTGIDSDTGVAHDEAAVRADLTVAMAARKPGHLFGAGREHSGDVEVVDIGIPPHLVERALGADGSARIATDRWVSDALPTRPAEAHKGSVGLALVAAGSDRYTGAAVLASLAAARIGAGYVTCATTPSTRAALDALSPSTATVALPTTDDGGIAADAAEEVLARASTSRALLVGPGLGSDASTVRFARHVLERAEIPTVVDADGLNALATVSLDAFPEEVRARWVLTPHLGEFRRLVRAAGGDPESIDLDRRTWLAREWAARFGSTLVLKGAPTVVAEPGGVTFVAAEVEPALATAGSGDVLAGAITGLLAQGLRPLEAAVCAQHLGAAAARNWRERHAERSLLAEDLVEGLTSSASSRSSSS